MFVILGATDDPATKGLAPVAIGLTLTLIHLVSIPIDNTSVNPAGSLGVAWFAGGPALRQVWLFIAALVLVAVIAGASYARMTGATRINVVDAGIAKQPSDWWRNRHPLRQFRHRPKGHRMWVFISSRLRQWLLFAVAVPVLTTAAHLIRTRIEAKSGPSTFTRALATAESLGRRRQQTH